MINKLSFATLLAVLLTVHAQAQTTNGLMTGSITDPSGFVVAGARIQVTNEGTGQIRTTTTGANGAYIVPQLPPGIYDVSIAKQGFATEERKHIQLVVNQNATLDFKLTLSATAVTIEVTDAPPALDTSSATLATVIGHQTTVDLPLNGREFTQLALLTPGAAPVQASQQNTYVVALGAGGVSPSVNGQRGEQNNFTMDGVLNNQIFTNVWAIAPPPDAIQEFNVQSHITDAQFSISSGANINVVTRSGSNVLHGSVWEFFRNDALDAQTFPAMQRLPYKQNQYGFYLGGPVVLPRLHGKDNTWFSGYWEGYRSSLSNSYFATTLTTAMTHGNFSAVATPIYDPATSRPDPAHPTQIIRDAFPGNMIPPTRINPATALILQKYYPAPNLPGLSNNYQFTGVNSIKSDVAGIRLDHRFANNDILFGRYNRSNANQLSPEALPGYSKILSNYAQSYEAGYTRLFGTATVLNLRYGYMETTANSTDEPAGAAFADSINFSQAVPARDGMALGPQITISNGFSGVAQIATPLGPQRSSDYHADLSKIWGYHTFGAGGMFYHIYSYSDGWKGPTFFTQNGTSSNGGTASGYGPASFFLGVLDQYKPWTANSAAEQTINWYGGYVQDLWKASKRLTITVGLRYDFVTTPNFHKIISALDVLTGQFVVTGAVPAAGINQPTGPSGYFYPQYNGYEPRFGIVYQALSRTVAHGAFAILDDHNNTVVQENQTLRLAWPTAVSANLPSLDIALPQMTLDHLPTANSLLTPATPFAGPGANPHNKIPYSMEFNAGVQQQISNTMDLKVDYVGSLSRHQFLEPSGNTPLTPGAGSIASRQPFPQYGGPQSYEWNEGPGSYNALQVALKKSMSSGLSFLASYTWSKAMDFSSDPYAATIEDFYNMRREWGPSSFSIGQMFVLSGVYALPVGRGKSFLSNTNSLVQNIAGNWNVGTIITLDSGLPFNALAGADVANTGGQPQRAQRTGVDPDSGTGFTQTPTKWLNKNAFASPAQYTFGNEHRNDLVGPPHKNVDFNVFKEFSLDGPARLQFRAEFFNLFNHTYYGLPNTNVTAAAFGTISTAQGSGRQIQCAAKIIF